MKTLIDIDPALLKEAMTLAEAATKKETVRLALEELIRARQRRSLKALAGSGVLDWTLPALRRARRRSARRHPSRRNGAGRGHR